MFEAKCLDMHGNSIDSFTQWDIDQSMVIKLDSCDDINHDSSEYLRLEPEVHFSNCKRDKALVVRASVIRNDEIFVKVPNILLTEGYPLLIYVYYTNSNEPSAQATIVRTELPVRKRNEPHDYYYVENIERITAEQIKKEIEAETEETRLKAIDEIISEKGIAVDTINEEEGLALQAIDDAEAASTERIETYIAEAEQIKEDTDAIKTDTQAIKDDTQAIKEDTQTIKEETAAIRDETQVIADNTVDEIVAEIEQVIYVSGLELYTTDDGNGNVTTTIVVPHTE